MHTRRFIRQSLLALSILLVALMLMGGCAPAVGDSCASNSDCPSNAICDSTAPNGYCTIPECTVGSCPGDAICVEFDRESAFCMEFCEDANDCRKEYVCRDDPNTRPFCYTEQ